MKIFWKPDEINGDIFSSQKTCHRSRTAEVRLTERHTERPGCSL